MVRVVALPIVPPVLTLSPPKAEKLASPTVTNSRKAEKPACRSLIYSRKAEIWAWKFQKKLLKIMLCLGAPGLGTKCCGSSGVRWLNRRSFYLLVNDLLHGG